MKTHLDKALAKLKKRIQADAAYAVENELSAKDIYGSFDFSDLEEIILPLYEAALKAARS